jgi:hypothetical protein
VLDFPHPLLADDVDGKRVGWRLAQAHEDHGAEDEERDGDANGDAGPENFESDAVVDVVGVSRSGARR